MTPDAQPSELMALLDVQLEERTRTRVSGSVAADERHHRGIVHGELYTSVIETFATLGAFEAVKESGLQAVAVGNATNFFRPHKPLYLRRSIRPTILHSVAAARMDTRTIRRWIKEIGSNLPNSGEFDHGLYQRGITGEGAPSSIG